MGCGGSISAEEAEQRAQSAAIDKEIQNTRKNAAQEVKMLLLGAGASGKSTIVKQMKLLYLEGFSEKETIILKEIVFFNIIKDMKTLCEKAKEFGYDVADKNRAAARELRDMQLQLSDVQLTEERSKSISALWADPVINTKVVGRSSEFLFEDSAPYFFDNLKRISTDPYVPSIQDILRVRAKTTGIVETEFLSEGMEFTIVDVGGQRNERKKWIHAFGDVTAIIFVVGVSEYDQVLEEDLKTNRMVESLKLFEDVSNSKWFETTPMILFLNKKDLFEEKIKTKSLKIWDPNYDGPENDYEAGMEYIKNSFLAVNNTPKDLRPVYCHQTCATDTENIKVVFSSVTEIFLQEQLKMNGLY